jgi:hypothetical protein
VLAASKYRFYTPYVSIVLRYNCAKINIMQNKSNVSHSISLEEAIELTTRFRETRPNDVAICETLDKESVRKMLSTNGAEKLRVYHGRRENGEVTSVMVAADINGNDILPPAGDSNNLWEDDEALILDDTIRCPELCPPPSPLNN